MNKQVARTTSPLADMLEWLDLGAPKARRGVGLAPYLRVEDFVEDGTYVLRAEVPGMDPDKDISVTVQGGMLTISGERREEKKDRNHEEFHYGSFQRSVSLPEGADVDRIEASYTDGVLEVRVPTSSGEKQEATTVPVKRS
ncbi:MULTISPECIES: Hsp20/alpha crystallin family protein [unclassified Ornithinimicrobium]|uniref:Hsp20/alpha crystallin family protein n=1 Tax=unclassified Ornithinimicrobium TaxID=2615080 RepID=UPI003851AC35